MKRCSGRITTLLCAGLLLVSCGREREKPAVEPATAEESGMDEVRVPTISGDLNSERAREIGMIMTGSWTPGYYDETIVRRVSWGEVAIDRHDFMIFDFLLSQPLLIWGASEGGGPIDQVVGRIVGMEIEEDSLWIYYRFITSWSPFEKNPETGNNWFTAYEPTDGETLGDEIWSLHIWYDRETDTLSVDPNIRIGGRRYLKDNKWNRISERL